MSIATQDSPQRRAVARYLLAADRLFLWAARTKDKDERAILLGLAIRCRDSAQDELRVPQDMNFVQIRSWHIRSGLVSRGGLIHTLCGKWARADAKTAPGLPSGKSCESCLRLQQWANPE